LNLNQTSNSLSVLSSLPCFLPSRGRRRVKAAGHAPCSPRAPSLAPPRSLSASPRGAISLHARRGLPSACHGDERAEQCRAPFPQPARALAWLFPLPLLRKRVSSLPLCSPPCSTRRAEPSAASRAAAACHLRRPSLGSRGAPSSGLPRAHPTPQLAPPPSVGAPRPTRRRPSPPERRRRKPSPPPAASLRGAARSGHPSPNRGHPEVELALLLLFPHFFPASGEPPRRIPAARPSSVSQTSQGPTVRRR